MKKFMSTLLGKLAATLVVLAAIVMSLSGHIYKKPTFGAIEPHFFDQVVTTGIIQSDPTNAIVNTFNGPTAFSATTTYGGISTITATSSMAQGTSTLCVLNTPSATSTLVAFNGNITTSTSTIALALLATSTQAYAFNVQAATTSLIAQEVITGGTTPDFYFQEPPITYQAINNLTGNIQSYPVFLGTSTPSAPVIGPSQFLLFYAHGGAGIAEATIGGSVWAGKCNATFRLVQ